MTRYDFKSLEAKWRPRWEQMKLHRTPEKPKRKQYILEMFAYPSGDMHMGHFRNYSIGDVVARHRMMAGYDVLHPFGWDAFGLPAENAAIKHGTHPRDWTLKNIETGRRTLQKMGISYDWDREFITCEPDYYKWTQWLFLLLYKKGLAYRAGSLVNWCPNDGILANELVHDGRCWRCEAEVGKKEIENCWWLKYSSMAQRLLDDLDTLDGWPQQIKTLQRNWIGRSEGCEIDFEYEGEKLSVFTTRPDTTWGVTFMVVAPEHPIAAGVARSQPEVAEYIKQAARKKEWERTAEGEKDGIFTGKHVTNLLNGEQIQLWVADYVVATYGTGVVMGVPAHDTRDFAFAKKYGIPIRVVIQPKDRKLTPESMEEAYTDEGVMANSGDLDGTESPSAISDVIAFIDRKGFGRATVKYRLKDWLLSRQRYWGCPIPIVHCAACGEVPVPDDQLPVLLPLDQKEFIPRGRSPLADNEAFVKTTCPKCGGPAERDPDTMDTFMCSAWYQFRYVDAHNDKESWTKKAADDWLPIDLYIGGAEHACMHLLYFRFITKVLYDAGHVPMDEPTARLFNHGMVYDADGKIMSKAKGNAVSPVEIMEKWGVDICRIAMFFFAPSSDEVRWKEDGLIGAQRFVTRFWDRVTNAEEREDSKEVTRKLHQVIGRVTRAMESTFTFNTSIAAVMEFLNLSRTLSKSAARMMTQLIAPMAPFMAEELWEKLGGSTSVFRSGWPAFDEALAREEEVTIVVQVNGKKRGNFTAARGAGKAELEKRALEEAKKFTFCKQPRKVIVVPDRLVNIVV